MSIKPNKSNIKLINAIISKLEAIKTGEVKYAAQEYLCFDLKEVREKINEIYCELETGASDE